MALKAISKRAMLVILDGVGINPESQRNAVKEAKTPNLDQLFENYPFTTIKSGGVAVGLPDGVMGNSEVGHMNIGAGRPVRQDLVRINETISQNKLGSLEKLGELIEHAKKTTKRIHLMGLLSDGGVHSHIDHIIEICKVLQEHSEIKVYFHAFMDGRDTSKTNGVKYIGDFQKQVSVPLVSMQGRSIAMDRDRRWEKIERAYNCMTGKDGIESLGPVEYIKSQYENDLYDEFITPALFDKDGAIKNDDALFFVNFRPDRAKQITLAFMDPKFKEFRIDTKPSYFLCMTPYVADEVSLPILFDKEKITGGLSEYISKLGLKQFKIAETEKYAHVTYFFNGGEEKPFPGEERCLVQSPKDVATYDEKPEMSAYEVTDHLINAISDKTIDLIVVNYANCDMVGHTGNFEAAIKAVETVDDCVGKLLNACENEDITMLTTADHGNCDEMTYENGDQHTAHSKAPVPFSVWNKKLKGQKLETKNNDFALKDIAPTITHVMGLETPKSFTGTPIFE